MSIKTIDSQIMIARTADFSRDTSALQKRPEVTQDFQAIKEKINDAHDQSRVGKSQESQKPEMQPDEGGDGRYYGSASGEPENENPDDTGQNLLVPPSDNVIDIKV